MQRESTRERIGFAVGVLGTVIPGMIVTGFMPLWDVMPTIAWFGVAAVTGALGGAIATPQLVRGAASGLLAGLGAIAGLWLYVTIRSSISENFLKIELVGGALLGAAPGLVLFSKWARAQPRGEVSE